VATAHICATDGRVVCLPWTALGSGHFFGACRFFAMVGLAGNVARDLQEEIGWRGFLLPRQVCQFGFTLGYPSGCI
jgi:hypothetical protein